MELVAYILAKAVDAYLGLASLAMLLRVLLQFFASEGNRLLALCYAVSEPIVMPFRLLFAKLGIGEGALLDIPFFAGYMSLALIQIILPPI